MRFLTVKCSFFSVALSLLFVTNGIASDNQELNRKEQKVIDYLVKDWAEDFNVTSVDTAMHALKIRRSDETSFRIGSYIKEHPELHEVVRRWGWVTLVLTNDEKLIARALINAERDGRPSPATRDLAIAVGISEAHLKRGLVMLERYEIIRKEGGAKKAYRVISRYLKWEPRLDFVFHKLTLDSGRQFNVN